MFIMGRITFHNQSNFHQIQLIKKNKEINILNYKKIKLQILIKNS